MSNFKVLFLQPNLMLQTTLPLGIAILSSTLKNAGYVVDIFDTTFYKTEDISSDDARVGNLQISKFTLNNEIQSLRTKQQMHDDLFEKVNEFKPNLIAVSIFEDLYPLTLKLLHTIKDFNIFTIAGGPFPTVAPEKVIKEPTIDAVCIGEGETALLDLCNKLSTNNIYTSINNLWVKKNNVIIKNNMNDPIDLNQIQSPDFSIFDKRRFYKPMKGKVYRTGLIETHRGCPYTCTFCSSHALSKLYKQKTGINYFRSKNINKIHDEIKSMIEKYDIEFLYFTSEVLLNSRKYIKEFSEMYEEFKLPFFCQSRAEAINEETVGYLKDMNCHSIAIGIEHGNENFRYNILNRKVSNKTYINALDCLEKTDIKVSVNNIIGFPDETRELIFDTINLNKQFNVYQINAYFFTPYHGTALRDYCVKKGYIKENTQTNTVTKTTVLNMPSLSQEEIKGLVRTFNLYVRFPKERYSEIKKAERFTDEGNLIFNKLKDEYWEKYLK